MGILWYVIFVGLAILYLKWLIIHKNVAKDIPGPSGVPIIGSFITLMINWNRLQEWIFDMYKIYGTTIKFWFIGGPTVAILVVEPSCVEYILKSNFNNFVKGERFHDIMEPLLGNGIFAVDGLLWKKQRQVASHQFSVNSLKAMLNTFVHHGHIVLDILKQMTPKEEVDIQDIFFRYTLDSIGVIAFGKDIGSLRAPQSFASAFDSAQAAIDRAFGNPLLAMFPRFNPGLFANRDILNKYVYGLIQERRRESPSVLETKTDLLSRYMCLIDEDTGQPYTDDYLRDIVLNFIIAGRDTTAQLLSWTFHMLSTHPKEQETLYKEIQDTFPNNEDPDYETVNKMIYLKAILNETLRLYPSVPVDTKEALEDDVLPNGYKVPKGAWVIYSPWVSGRAKEYWDTPDEFRPSRWLENQNKGWAFVPFQGGPRICLGQNMAYIEAKVLTSMIIGKYKVTAVPSHKVTYKRSLTLPSNGVKLYFQPRQLD